MQRRSAGPTGVDRAANGGNMPAIVRQRRDDPEPGTVPGDRYERLVAEVDSVAEVIEAGVGLSGEQLQALRRSSRRLRRAIEIHTIAASLPCRRCGRVFVRVSMAERHCCDACRGKDSAGCDD